MFIATKNEEEDSYVKKNLKALQKPELGNKKKLFFNVSNGFVFAYV